jgi:hypothetical protein
MKRDAPINPESVPFFDSYLTLINVTVMIFYEDTSIGIFREIRKFSISYPLRMWKI